MVNIFDKVKKILIDCGVSESFVKPDANIYCDLVLDSLAIAAELMPRLEEEFEIELDYEFFDQVTVQGIVDKIGGLIAEKTSV